MLLLFASCIFYMAFIPAYIFILAALILIDYIAAILIEKSNDRQKKVYLIASIFSTCITLFFFKYFNFFNLNLSALSNFLHWNYSMSALSLLLPIGLSFHTFQSLAYVIEVYRGNFKAERHLGIYALYVMFYPQLVAGPIERPQHLLPQFYLEQVFKYDRVISGIKRMLWGMFKKVVIADNLASLVNIVYSHPHEYSGPYLLQATIFFAIQIYCDFSGYVDIAIGSARVMGFELVENFNKPYLATSVSDFWRRWHMSLSFWFRDYVYIPLGGNRSFQSRTYLNIFTVFLLSGLWHGANWTFVLWGGLHGMYVISSKATVLLREKIVRISKLHSFPKLHNCIQIILTLSLVAFAWIFFRANNINDALYVASHLFTGGWSSIYEFLMDNYLDGLVVWILQGVNSVLLLFLICISPYLFRAARITKQYGGLLHFFLYGPMLPLRWITCFVLLWGILLFGPPAGEPHEFIYFAF